MPIFFILKPVPMNLNWSVFTLYIFLFGFPVIFYAQPSSFQFKMDEPGFVHHLIANKYGDVVMLLNRSIPSYNCVVSIQEPFASPQQGFCLSYSSNNISFVGFNESKNVLYINDQLTFDAHFFGTTISGYSVTSINLATGSYWCKKLAGVAHENATSFINDEDGNFYVAHAPTNGPSYPISDETGIIEFFKISPSGEVLEKNGFYCKKPVTGEKLFRMGICGLERAETGDFFLTGYFFDAPTSISAGGQVIIKLNSNGELLMWKMIPSLAFGETLLTEDGLYLLDKKVKDGYNGYPSGNNPSRALLVKLDHDLNLVWAKKYYGENFQYTTASIKATEDGELLLAHSTVGAFPVILTRLDGEGNIVSQKGYPNISPKLNVAPDGSLLMASAGAELDSNGQITDYVPVIAKTDPDGNIAGCQTYPTCLFSADTTITFGTFDIEPYEVVEPEDLVLQIEPVEFNFEEFCEFPPAPVPDFDFPDTLCQGDIATSASVCNRLAHARQWRLTGPGVDSTLRDSFEFAFRFDEPGGYTLRQSVWVLGCRTDFERSLTVLPELTVEILDSLACPPPHQFIRAGADRDAELLWGTGEVDDTINIFTGGIYSVTATDGVCTATDSAEVNLASGLMGGLPPFTLPTDTIGCTPFELVPESAFDPLFFTEKNPAPRPGVLLDVPGTYLIGAEVFGCTFWDEYKYGVDCVADVYLPNAFSPNSDGINDVFRPFGNEHEVLELSVFDRWGGLLHRGAEWDGGDAGPGIYTYKLVFRNLRNGLTEERHGEVLLVR